MSLGFGMMGGCLWLLGNEETYREQCQKSAFIYYKAWVLRQNHRQASINSYSNVLLLQNILISNNIKYLFWNSCGTVSLKHQNTTLMK